MVSKEFTFDGISSASKGLIIANTDDGIKALPYLPSKEIIEEQPNNVDRPYFYKTKKNPLTFSLTFTLEDEDWTVSKKMEIAQWLFKDTYKPFTTDDYPDKVFYVIGVNQADFMTADLTNGYFTVDFRMNAAHAYTTSGTAEYDLSSNTTTTDIVVNCLANTKDYFYPEVQIELKSTSTGFTIVNLSDGNRETSFTGLDLLETITLSNRQIISSTGSFRYNDTNFNKVWLRLVYGNNTLRVTGKCVLTFNTQYPVFV